MFAISIVLIISYIVWVLSLALKFHRRNQTWNKASIEIERIESNNRISHASWNGVIEGLKAKIIDKDDDPEIGTLLEADVPNSGKERFLRVQCGTKRLFVLPVPREVKTALEASAWTYGLDTLPNLNEYKPEIRT